MVVSSPRLWRRPPRARLTSLVAPARRAAEEMDCPGRHHIDARSLKQSLSLAWMLFVWNQCKLK
eukprot:5484306-Pleurochrysis_carterae.AAC.1